MAEAMQGFRAEVEAHMLKVMRSFSIRVNGEEALHMDEVDLETVAGNVADSLSQIFLLTPRAEIRARAYELMGAHSAREFAAHVERRINAYLQLGNEANDNRSILEIRKERDAARAMIRSLFEQNGPQALAELYREEPSFASRPFDRMRHLTEISSCRTIDHFNNCNTDGILRGKSCSNVDLTNESNGEFSDQQKFYTGDFSEDGFSSQNDRNTFSSSEDDTFSVDKGHSMYTSDTAKAKNQMPRMGSVQLSCGEYERSKLSSKTCHRSGRNSRTDVSTKKTSFSSAEFTDESNQEISQQLKIADDEWSGADRSPVGICHDRVSSDEDFSSNKENTSAKDEFSGANRSPVGIRHDRVSSDEDFSSNKENMISFINSTLETISVPNRQRRICILSLPSPFPDSPLNIPGLPSAVSRTVTSLNRLNLQQISAAPFTDTDGINVQRHKKEKMNAIGIDDHPL
ncbi:hypothetical protein Tcan_05705 [Toxocara canis]|uniref:Uncharacterized protein n=1 Tax=Toxocara canis TaxID=6265 RepID=A0A0B2VJJ8_TOXCA|nr:hypothetical protein Tcan_05705 [Toxocara canis]